MNTTNAVSRTGQFSPEEITLSNGMPVMLQHFEGTVATLYWWIQVGSCDEKSHETGFAHFLEHMLFKDTSAKETGKPSTGQTARAIESLGGDINAYTSFDQTVYHVTCAEKHFEKIIDEFGKLAKLQKFLNEDFKREKEVILEELKKGNDSPGRQIFQNLFSGSFKSHPYGRPVIGYEKVLIQSKVKELETFYNNHYHSGRMGLIIVAPFLEESGAKKKSLIKKIEKCFGSKVIQNKKKVDESRAIEKPLQKKPDVKISEFQVQTPSVAFAFRVPELKHRDLPALDLLSGILGFGESSRLYQELFYKRSLVTEVSSGLFVPKDPGILYFNLDAENPTLILKAIEAAFSVIVAIQKTLPDMEEIKRVITNIESEKLYATQTVDGMASRIGYLKFILGDLDFDQKYIQDLKNVTPEDIQKVALKYFVKERMSVSILTPKKTLKEIPQKTILNFIDEYFPSATDQDTRTKKVLKNQKFQKRGPSTFVTDSGMKVIHFERPHSHVTSVHLSMLGGSRLEIAELGRGGLDFHGASFLNSLTWAKGTDFQTAQEITKKIESRAAQLDGFSGRNSIGLEMTCLARDWVEMSELFREVMFYPSFSEDEIHHSKRIIEDSLKSLPDHSAQVCSQLFLETLYEHHPYGKLIYGSFESIKNLGRDSLRKIHQEWVQSQRCILSISGALSAKELEKFIFGIEGEWKKKTPGTRANDIKIDDEIPMNGPRWVEKYFNREQLHIITGNLGIRYSDQDRFALRLLQTILGGQSGRLFIELREKKSLAYTVSPMMFEGIEKGYAGIYIACSPSKKEEALKGIQTVVEKFSQTGPSVSELKRAKEYYLGQKAMELQSDHSLAAHYGLQMLYGTTPEDESKNEKELLKVTAQDIQKVTKKYFLEPPKITSIVG